MCRVMRYRMQCLSIQDRLTFISQRHPHRYNDRRFSFPRHGYEVTYFLFVIISCFVGHSCLDSSQLVVRQSICPIWFSPHTLNVTHVRRNLVRKRGSMHFEKSMH
jgi:hypothetical protein